MRYFCSTYLRAEVCGTNDKFYVLSGQEKITVDSSYTFQRGETILLNDPLYVQI